MAAQTTGVLRTVGAGILGIREPSGRVLGLMLPSGYTVRDDAVLDNQGSAIAKVGDSIQVDGGEVKAGWWEVCAGSLVLLPAPSGWVGRKAKMRWRERSMRGRRLSSLLAVVALV
jgi:hypothetical protein